MIKKVFGKSKKDANPLPTLYKLNDVYVFFSLIFLEFDKFMIFE